MQTHATNKSRTLLHTVGGIFVIIALIALYLGWGMNSIPPQEVVTQAITIQ